MFSEAVAMVIANSLEAALMVSSGLLSTMMYYRMMQSKSAILPDAPVLYDGLTSNVLVDTTLVIKTPRTPLFHRQLISLSMSSISSVTGVTMEPRSALATMMPKPVISP